MGLILASASPRRADLLRAAGISFQAVGTDVDEDLLAGERAAEAVQRLAEAKAASVAPRFAGQIVLGADTLVAIDGVPLGKPDDNDDAARMLSLLSGRTHDVLTGICLCRDERRLHHVEVTRVRMAAMTPAEIVWYVSSGEPVGKAGAYAVQGLASRFVEAVDGSYSNVVGLPVSVVYRLMRELDCDILGHTKIP